MGTLKVGAARVCINPTPDMMPFPCGMGQAAYYTNIMSNCYVRACVIDNGHTTAAIVGFDLAGPPDTKRIKGGIAAQTGIPEEHILLSAIHNHTGCGVFSPSCPEDEEKGRAYEEMVIEKGIAAVQQAMDNREEALYGYGEGKSYINMNRDRLCDDGSYIQGPDPEGYSDKNVYLLKFTGLDGHLICAIANYGMHATLGFMETDTDGQMKMSANIPGYAEEYVENRFPGSVVIWTSSAAGDQNPYLFCLTDYEPDGFPYFAKWLPGAQYQLIGILGRQHGVDICKGLNSIDCKQRNMPIHFTETHVMLPGQKPPVGADMARNSLLVSHREHLAPGEQFVQMEDDPEHPFDLYLQQAVLGDIAFIGFGAELYSRLGRDCMEVSPYKKTFIITHAARARGYIVDRYSAGHTTFQTFGPIRPGKADKPILEAIQSQFDRLAAQDE